MGVGSAQNNKKTKSLQGVAELVGRRAHTFHLDGAARRDLSEREKYQENQELIVCKKNGKNAGKLRNMHSFLN